MFGTALGVAPLDGRRVDSEDGRPLNRAIRDEQRAERVRVDRSLGEGPVETAVALRNSGSSESWGNEVTGPDADSTASVSSKKASPHDRKVA